MGGDTYYLSIGKIEGRTFHIKITPTSAGITDGVLKKNHSNMSIIVILCSVCFDVFLFCCFRGYCTS